MTVKHGSGPIFLAGVDRSGIGLLREVLNTHPAIHLSRRTRFWNLYADRFGDLDQPANIRRAIETMSSHPRVAELQPEPERLVRELSQRHGTVTYGALFEAIHHRHLEQIGKSRWGDKSLNAESHAERIFAEFPDAVIIHVIRDPRDRYISHASHRGTPRGSVGAGTALWLWSASLANQNRSRFPDRYHVIRYEDMVGRPRTTIEHVCDLVGERFDSRMLTSFTMPPSHRPSEPLDPTLEHAFSAISVGRFSADLSRRHISFIDLAAARLMDEFGYETAEIRLAGAERVRFVLVDLPVNWIRMFAWRLNTMVRHGTHRRKWPPYHAP